MALETTDTETLPEAGIINIEELIPYEETDDPETKAHIINPPANVHIWKEGMTAQDVVNAARALQIEIQALCGHVFIPKHNPDKFDVCEPCVEIAGDIMRELGE